MSYRLTVTLGQKCIFDGMYEVHTEFWQEPVLQTNHLQKIGDGDGNIKVQLMPIERGCEAVKMAELCFLNK
jgi:hypothetical protein